jgi:hypothetical protein
VSDEAERSVLVKLKTECGYQFTSKLESMFTDIKTSRDTMQEYKARRQAAASSAAGAEEDVELSVQVGPPCTPSVRRKRFSVRMLILFLAGRCCSPRLCHHHIAFPRQRSQPLIAAALRRQEIVPSAHGATASRH